MLSYSSVQKHLLLPVPHAAQGPQRCLLLCTWATAALSYLQCVLMTWMELTGPAGAALGIYSTRARQASGCSVPAEEGYMGKIMK